MAKRDRVIQSILLLSNKVKKLNEKTSFLVLKMKAILVPKDINDASNVIWSYFPEQSPSLVQDAVDRWAGDHLSVNRQVEENKASPEALVIRHTSVTWPGGAQTHTHAYTSATGFSHTGWLRVYLPQKPFIIDAGEKNPKKTTTIKLKFPGVHHSVAS